MYHLRFGLGSKEWVDFGCTRLSLFLSRVRSRESFLWNVKEWATRARVRRNVSIVATNIGDRNTLETPKRYDSLSIVQIGDWKPFEVLSSNKVLGDRGSLQNTLHRPNRSWKLGREHSPSFPYSRSLEWKRDRDNTSVFHEC